jgi:uncharacterized membrane protein YdjX (TVP38/TMEM64 family)
MKSQATDSGCQADSMQTSIPASPTSPTSTTVPPDAPMERAKRPLVRALVLVGVLAAALVTVQAPPVRALLKDTEQLRQTINAMGPLAYPVCLVVSAVLIGSGFPRLVLCGAASMVLGFGWGLGLTQGGALLGYYAVFCFIRWGGGDWISSKRPKLRAIADTIQDQGVVGVVLARQIPIHGTVINFCLGLSRVKHRHFLIGTIIGILPEAVPVALAGAGVVRSSLTESAWMLGLAALGFVLLWVGGACAFRRLRDCQRGEGAV